jgi:Tol biopolymer transport system component
VKKFKPRFLLQRLIHWSLSLGIAGLVVACGSSDRFSDPSRLNSRYNDEQPALSGNGRFLAFVSNRNASRSILLYDLQQQQLIPLPQLNRRDTIAENPSLSYTGRYIVYIVADQGKPTVALYDRATQQSQLLTQWYPGWVRHPSISPDGRYIVFESGSRGQWDIEVLDRGSNIELDIPDGAPVRSSALALP